MKKSFSNRLANKLFKLINIKSFYQNKKYLQNQKKRLKKEIKAPFTHRHLWTSHKVEKFNFFETKNKIFSKVIIYFHGGGFLSQPNLFHWIFLKKIYSNTNAKLFFPIYPKAPLYNYETCYNFLFDFLKIIKPELENKEIIFMGDSAGGNIALSFSLQIKNLNISKNILFSPCLDLTLSNPEIENIEKKELDIFLSKAGLLENYKKWAGGDALLHTPILSPINSPLKNLPFTIIFVGTNEILYPEALEFYNKAKKIGKKVVLFIEKGQSHAFPLHPFKESEQTVQKIIELVNQ